MLSHCSKRATIAESETYARGDFSHTFYLASIHSSA